MRLHYLCPLRTKAIRFERFVVLCCFAVGMYRQYCQWRQIGSHHGGTYLFHSHGKCVICGVLSARAAMRTLAIPELKIALVPTCFDAVSFEDVMRVRFV